MASNRMISRAVRAAAPVAPFRAQHVCRHTLLRPRWQCSSRIPSHIVGQPAQCRHISTERQPGEQKPSEQYNFAKVKELVLSTSDAKPILIDVREPHEYAAGHIPGAINLPIQSQPDALFLKDEEFEDRFGMNKPGTEQEVVFYCKAGVRSRAAAQFARENSYTRIGEYPGSWIDWVKNGGEESKP